MKEALHASIDRADLVLSPVATRLDQAERWLAARGGALDGVIAKLSDEPYHQGERAMRKVKQLRTADCGVGGYRQKAKGGGASLLLGLYDAHRSEAPTSALQSLMRTSYAVSCLNQKIR